MKNDLASGKKVRMSRRASFSSAHFYSNKDLSEKENQQTFGKCFTQYGHGHNYVLEVYFEGKIDEKTGLIVNLLEVDDLLKEVIEQLDHRHLNFDVKDFESQIPTTENLARYCFKKIENLRASRLSKIKMKLYKVRLFENEDLWVEYGVSK